MVTIISKGHGGTLVPGKPPVLQCDCGAEPFAVTRNREGDFDSPDWVAHVIEARRLTNTTVLGSHNGVTR